MKNSGSPITRCFALAITALLPALSGCEGDAAKLFDALLGPLVGIRLQRPKLPKKSAAQSEQELPSADNRQLNADFIRELHRIVLLRDLRSREEFDRYMNVMDQGGTYEGIYNGIVYAIEYREKEKGVAPVPALKAYTEIMADIRLAQQYDSLKIKEANQQQDSSDPDEAVPPPQPTDAERIALMGEIEKEGITKSTFYLKRALGEQLFNAFSLKKEYREKLATWYARFSVSLNKRGIDFGIPERNKTNEYFHYKWALTADDDRIKWECINRIHRVLNASAGLREPTPLVPPTTATPSDSPNKTPASSESTKTR